jgi:hypothetical protein
MAIGGLAGVSIVERSTLDRLFCAPVEVRFLDTASIAH